MTARAPLSTLLSQVLVAFTIELDNEFERRMAEAGQGRRFGVSLVMWSNFLRFVGDGATVEELPTVAALPKTRMLSVVGGMERWGYVVVGSATADRPPKAKRDGWGSGRGLRRDWVVRPTPAGRKAAEIWRPLFNDIEKRWEERFGADAIDQLRSLLDAIVAQLDVELPEFLPIVGSTDGMAAGLAPLEGRGATAGEREATPRHLSALLSQVLLAYTLDFELESELSLPLAANFVRVLDEAGVTVRDIPLVAGVSPEATSMALRYLEKAGYVVVDSGAAGAKQARLTPKGRQAQRGWTRLHARIEERWAKRFGADDVRRLRASLERLLDRRDGERSRMSRGLEPHPGGWRGTKRYLAHTKAMLDDPRQALPHYPMVLHRGGWPDGS